MTGKDLIDFITKNDLQNENITIEYFSFDKRIKFCGKCESLVTLEKFHKGTNGSPESQSSCYRYICKECFNKQAFHKKYKRKEENGI